MTLKENKKPQNIKKKLDFLFKNIFIIMGEKNGKNESRESPD